MPQHKDHCRSCGATVFLDAIDGAEVNGEVCEGCAKTVCAACRPKDCPHPDLPRNPGTVSEEEHDKLRAELTDEEALMKRINELRIARGETPVGI